MGGKEQTNKPKLRGIIHACAFCCTIATTIAFAIVSTLYRFDFSIALYQLSQLLQYGISSFYHILTWAPKTRKIMRHLDHMCIFVLISGTQTSVLINITDVKQNQLAKSIIKLSWTISAVGILKIALMNRLHNIFDLLMYIAHGMVVAPFYRILLNTSIVDRLLVAAGALLYLAGGLVYGLEKPNPSPRMFGYHEVFHAFTIAANMCFAAIITRRYLSGVLSFLFASAKETYQKGHGTSMLL